VAKAFHRGHQRLRENTDPFDDDGGGLNFHIFLSTEEQAKQ
jgi:hypothetical protein